MSKAVCGDCGRANGWHLWGCPNLLKFHHVQVFGIAEDMEKHGLKPDAVREVEAHEDDAAFTVGEVACAIPDHLKSVMTFKKVVE